MIVVELERLESRERRKPVRKHSQDVVAQGQNVEPFVELLKFDRQLRTRHRQQLSDTILSQPHKQRLEVYLGPLEIL
jgi:hypothetical protein